MNNEYLQQEESQLREQVAALSLAQKKQYYAQELRHIKDPETYAALHWACIAGLHHFYLGKWHRGILNVGLVILGGLLYFTNVFALLGLALIILIFIIELPQLFNSQNTIYRYNNQLMRSLLQQFNR